MSNETRVKRSSGNVFADIGLPDAGAHSLKAQVVALIAEAIRQRGFTQKEAALCMGIAQPDVSKMLRGRFEGFSLERLLMFLAELGNDVRINVTPANENEQGRLCLAFG